MLGNAEGSPIQYAPPDLGGHRSANTDTDQSGISQICVDVDGILIFRWSCDLVSCTYICPASCSPQFQFASLCASHPSLSSASGAFSSPSHLVIWRKMYTINSYNLPLIQL